MQNKIPEDKYFFHEHIGNYITMELFDKHHTKEEREIFLDWMSGQTCSSVDGVCAIYSWDYERWIRQGKKSEQGIDWD